MDSARARNAVRQLETFVAKERSKGIADADILASLLQAGWNKKTLARVFKQVSADEVKSEEELLKDIRAYIRKQKKKGIKDEEIRIMLADSPFPQDLIAQAEGDLLNGKKIIQELEEEAKQKTYDYLYHKYSSRHSHFYSKKLQEVKHDEVDEDTKKTVEQIKKENDDLKNKFKKIEESLLQVKETEEQAGKGIDRRELLAEISALRLRQAEQAQELVGMRRNGRTCMNDEEVVVRRPKRYVEEEEEPREESHVRYTEEEPRRAPKQYIEEEEELPPRKPVVPRAPMPAQPVPQSAPRPAPQPAPQPAPKQPENVTLTANTVQLSDLHEGLVENKLELLEERFKNLMTSQMQQVYEYRNPVIPEKIEFVHETVGDRAQTGIKGLDPVIEGGLKRNSATMVAGGPGTGKTTFALQYLVTGALKYNEPGIYITFEQQESTLIETAMMFGWDLRALIDSKMLVIRESSPEQIDKMLKAGGGSLRDLIESTGAARIVIDSITAFIMLYDGEIAQRRACLELFHSISKWNCTSLVIVEEEYVSGAHKPSVLEYETDGVIILYNERRGDLRQRSLEIFKMRGTKHAGRIFPMRLTREGLVIYPEQSF